MIVKSHISLGNGEETLIVRKEENMKLQNLQINVIVMNEVQFVLHVLSCTYPKKWVLYYAISVGGYDIFIILSVCKCYCSQYIWSELVVPIVRHTTRGPKQHVAPRHQLGNISLGKQGIPSVTYLFIFCVQTFRIGAKLTADEFLSLVYVCYQLFSFCLQVSVTSINSKVQRAVSDLQLHKTE